MKKLVDLGNHALDDLHARAKEQYTIFRSRGLSLNMARGKPAPEQLDLAEALLDLPGAGNHTARDGTDCRNYGGLSGLQEVRSLFGGILGAPPGNVIVAGNASLALMYDYIAFSLLKGNPDSPQPWCREGVRFLCPVPGYDRHFAICEELGIEMINVPMGEEGPDMDEVESRVKADPAIKGIWCVPKYSNPTGAIYSEETVRRLAEMPTAAPDFRIFWDNAYTEHHLTPERIEIANLLEACERAGHANRALMFGSTSKITFAGGGMAAVAASQENLKWLVERMSARTIGPDKINQLRHARLIPDLEVLHRLMDAHREIMAPKFQVVEATFDRLLREPGIARWTRPKGGYFISIDGPPGTARRVVDLAREAGLVLTPAGASFPYGRDPDDRYLRVAPTFPSVEDVRQAAEGIAACMLLAASEHEKAGR